MTPIVELEGLTKRFGDFAAVDGLDLTIPAGICYGLLGPNGAGKTTTLRMIYGVTEPTEGKAKVFGLDVGERKREVRSRLGVTLQENSLIEPLSAAENLRVFGRYHLMDGPKLDERVDELIDFLALGSHRDVPVRNLSGGFQRRVAIALSLMNSPELLVLDEPTTGLDPAVRLTLWSRVRALRDRGTTVLLTTHYMDEAERLCDRVGIVAGGRLIAEDSPEALIRDTLAADTVEVDCSGADEARIVDGFSGIAARLRVERRLMLHVPDGAALVEHMRGRGGAELGRIINRPTTLEDVFIALTGTGLEGAE